jgi:hypothetical protein
MRTTPEAWYQCMDRALHAIRHPYRSRDLRHRGQVCLHLYHIPSFANCAGCTVYDLNGTYEVKIVVWEQPADGRRIADEGNSASPEPTLTTSVFPLDAAWWEARMDALSAIHVPLLAAQEYGMDGEYTGINLFDAVGVGTFAVEWWAAGPDEWAELADWADEVLDVFGKLAA